MSDANAVRRDRSPRIADSANQWAIPSPLLLIFAPEVEYKLNILNA